MCKNKGEPETAISSFGQFTKGVIIVSSNNSASTSNYNSKSVRDTLNRFKMESSKELGVDLSSIDTLTTVQAGSVGGRMVQKMINIAKNS